MVLLPPDNLCSLPHIEHKAIVAMTGGRTTSADAQTTSCASGRLRVAPEHIPKATK